MAKWYVVSIGYWDCENGEVIDRERYLVKAENEEEAQEKVENYYNSWCKSLENTGFDFVTSTYNGNVYSSGETSIQVFIEVTAVYDTPEEALRDWSIVEVINGKEGERND